MPKKILFISRKWPPAVGGMETYSLELAAGIDLLAEVRTLALPGRPDGRAPGLVGYFLFLLKAIAFCTVRARAYDRVIFGDLVLFPAAVVHRLLHRRAKRLVVVYGLDLVYHRRNGLLPALYSVYFRLFRASQSCFDAIIAISTHTMRIALDNGLANVVVINPSLPEAKSQPLTEAGEPQTPESWDRASGTKRILYFGRLVPRKGALWFATHIMPLIGDRASFFVVGDSSQTEYKDALSRCPGTYCLGRLDSDILAAMIRTADAVVMPNISTPESVDVEGFGLAAIETSSMGGRLLASRIDGITDAVIDGTTGRLVEPANPQAWVSALIELFEAGPEGNLPSRESVASATREHFSRVVQATSFIRLLE